MRTLVIIFVGLTGCGAQLGDGPVSGGGSGSGSGKGDGDGSGTTELRAGAFLDQLGVVQCDHAFVCRADFPASSNVTFEQAVGTTAPECYADASAFYMPGAVEASITAGRITYDAAAAASCLAGITFPAVCTDYWQTGPQFPDVCNQSLVGLVGDGGICTVDFDCNSSTCDPSTKHCVAQMPLLPRSMFRVAAP